MQRIVADSSPFRWVPKRQVGVGAYCNGAFFRVKPAKLGVVRGCEGGEARKVDPALHHAFGEQDRQSRFDAGNTVRDPPETGLSLFVA